jgi:peptidoglycan-associated lipoprotein
MLTLLIAIAVTGCASTDKAEKPSNQPPPVSTTNRPSGPPPVASAAPPSTVGTDPLNDPNNVLAKRNVFFDYDQSALKNEYKPLVAAHAKYLSNHTGTRVKIEGNCDERGSREYNLALGQRRADTVKEAMKVLGVTDGQMETISWGKEKPVADGHDEKSWSQNRRDDIVYADK